MGRAIPSDSHRRRKKDCIKASRAKCWYPFEPESEDPIAQARDLGRLTSQVRFHFHDRSHICPKWSESLGFLNFRRAVFVCVLCVSVYVYLYVYTFFLSFFLVWLRFAFEFGFVGGKSMWVWFGLPFGFGNLLNQICDEYD